MILKNNSVLVDNDFFNHIIETRKEEDKIVAILKEAFTYLNLCASMHPLVYDNELIKNDRAICLFAKKVIFKLEFSDILSDDPEKKRYYIILVNELFNSLFGEPLFFSDDEIFTKWVRQKSLGEIHSLSTCLLCGCKLFLSDDKDSKNLKKFIDEKCMGQVSVLNRGEFFEKYIQEGGQNIPRSERRQLTHEF